MLYPACIPFLAMQALAAGSLLVMPRPATTPQWLQPTRAIRLQAPQAQALASHRLSQEPMALGVMLAKGTTLIIQAEVLTYLA